MFSISSSVLALYLLIFQSNMPDILIYSNTERERSVPNIYGPLVFQIFLKLLMVKPSNSGISMLGSNRCFLIFMGIPSLNTVNLNP